jgi:hypothetical protein
MSRFRCVFASRHVVLPIIHVSGVEQALRNAALARAAGADGAFLISHGAASDEKLLAIYEEARQALPGWWVGVNCLSWPAEGLFSRLPADAQGAWVDDAQIDESCDEQPAASRVLEAQRRSGWQGLYFGGVAFKYQRPVRDLAAAARRAVPYMDVVTTSGPGTGQAAAPAKVRAMKEAVGNAPLALASGVTPENVPDYLPWADCFLVSTGISYNFEELDPARLADLVRVVRAWGGQARARI